ncbi:MAG: 4-aminobutyrate--2-oxoglutarate transaminase [Desulfohalobiaceae bacterium]|nr:4-aminobutyrate--2-oxoglutarate transaminase [Desulfohalobiaceae bacterium]
MTAYTALQQRRAKSIPQGAYSVTPGFIQKAEGAMMIDVDGRELIDFAGGIGVNNVGHCHPRVVAAIQDQAGKFIHTCWHVGMYEAYVELAEKLNSLVPGDSEKMTMFANSGAEAVENAVKATRYATGRSAVVCFENAFHGRTLLGMSLTSKIKPYKYNFGPFAPEIYRAPFAYCYRCPFNLTHPGCDLACADHLEEFFINQVDPEDTAAVLAEPIQGEGGFITPPPGYFQRLQAICRKYEIPLIIDEVQSGAGRTGKFLAIEHWEGVEPDVITMAKSLAGGMPLSAITGRSEIMNKPHLGGLGGTYSGNPLACRAALAVLDALFEDKLIQRGAELGRKVRTRFEEMQSRYEIIGDVRGIGPMLAMELVQDRESKQPASETAKKLTQISFDKGLVLLSCGNYGNVIRTLMPFAITDEQLERGLQILEEGLKELG